MATVSDDQVRERLATVRGLIGRFELAVAHLHQEEKELEVALRVLERFEDRPAYDDLVAEEPWEAPLRPQVLMQPAKPADAPTMPEMIREVLARQGLFQTEGMRPKEIAEKIRELWWPDAPTTSVSPIAWRMWREGRLIKIDGVYALPNVETPAGETAGASEPGGRSGPLF